MKSSANKQASAMETARHRLADWLAEWELDLLLADPDPGAGDVASNGLPVGDAGVRLIDEEAAREGDIRLLKPVSGGWQAVDRPLYVAVLERCDGPGAAWIPFSRFTVPALPAEWKTGLRAGPLGVLCFWNARPVTGAGPSGWRVRRLTARQLGICKAVYREWTLAKAVPAGHEDRVGPPLWHPGDPRHRYVDQERDRLDVYFGGAPGRLRRTGESRVAYGSGPVPAGGQGLLAAEQRAAYGGSVPVYATGDGAVQVTVLDPGGARTRFRLTKADGSRCTDYDGGCVESTAGERSDPLVNGQAAGSTAMARDLAALLDAQGCREKVYKIKKYTS
jgi:hypothetical protein